MKRILVIDTSDNKLIKVGLHIEGKKDVEERVPDYRTQVVLPLIEELLKKHKLKLGDITSIEVNRGPGSFTGLRVGISIANTLGSLLQIPVNGKKSGDLVEAFYT